MAKILIADDMTTVLHNMSFILENNEHTVVGKAKNCTEAIEIYRKEKPDLLLLDILGMNSFFDEAKRVIDSFDVISILTNEYNEAKIIVLSASPKEEYIKKAISLGAKGFLVKGVPNEKIINTIENIINK